MSDDQDDRRVSVLLDDDFASDLARAAALTRIKNRADLIRYAVRRLVVDHEQKVTGKR